MNKLVLFDVDGTILWTAGAGRRAIRQALMARMGTAGPVDQFRFDGKTDPQIVRELLSAAGHPRAHDPDQIRLICEEYVGLLEAELSNHQRQVRLYAGVHELMDALEARVDTLLGLLTGNVIRGAELKLQSAGVDPSRFRVGAFGSDASERGDLPSIAASRAGPIMGSVPRGNAIVIIGDTPSDVRCGASVGARAIAVATGSYSADDLRAAGAYAVFEDLSDTEAVVEAIHS